MATIADVALGSALRLHTAATVVLFLISFVALVGIAGGLAFGLSSSDHSTRYAGVALAGSSLVVWIVSILPYLAAQALARYIEFQVQTRRRETRG